MKEAIFVIGIIIFLLFLYLNNRNQREKKEILDLNKNRPELRRQDYVNQISQKGFTKKHVEVLYDEIQKIIGIENFTIYPEDDLYENYGLWDLEDVELFDNVCSSLGIEKAKQTDLTEYGKSVSLLNAECVLTFIRILERKNTEYNKG